ncbi:PEP/pyruvate-binding domain-containing protein [Vitiosangium sp. GDMCC 1.1324]|uniref:PEP/pyruvate-binding domain-containing protein n=1 Tax=Vitiosangium sp. (strain GDMCC 1.1324) TaxID=2138576 RepID=UPI000D3711AA|nr:PEP/pyruvate-binding domain-containing protein [Vitiosangium sp. GDMCC 1.1324]PTL83926.1 pyruvate, phosphate dikinase [Vitiosangium sp. GDMCC 1.1324]
MTMTVCFFRELSAEQAPLAGGKGRTLAQLYRGGHPVPNGFVILASAFEGDTLAPPAWEQVRAALARLRAEQPGRSFAVRSSALSEDSAQASFAGEFETVLDVREDDAVRRAIDTVRKSRHAGRVAAYSQAQGLEAAHEVAVVVQVLVPADFAGVLFTADPVTGSRATMVGNYVRGLGERLVAGDTNAPSFTLRRPGGGYAGPGEMRRHARQLYRLAERLERELGTPQDIEWALSGGKLALLQARPITTLRGHNPATGEWNDSLTGDYLWTSTNLGEAVPGVMTPCTWSLLQVFIAETLPLLYVCGFQPVGNIGGRFYMNLSVTSTLGAAFGISRKRLVETSEEAFGKIPDDLEIPLLPVSRWSVLRELLPGVLRLKSRLRTNQKRFPEFIATAPARCDALLTRIQVTSRAADLIALWRAELAPFFVDCCRMLEAGARREGNPSVTLRRDLRKLVGDADTNALLSGLSSGANKLASLGPLLGLSQLARGEIDRETYARRYGHRSPHEFEVSIARPAEDPEWIDRQLAGLRDAPVDVDMLLARQKEAHEAAWERFRQRYPRRVAELRRRLDKVAVAAHAREAARSELIRVFWPLRVFVQRAGALTGQGEALFFLSIDEILSVLGGDEAPLAFVPARRETHARQAALPVYPALIRGRFDPFQWAADPRRRSDRFDANGGSTPASDAITGFPGAAGVVEGRARVLLDADEGERLQAGEILVTSVTNVGWTPLFPKAAAVVTDIGAPLSHAAIVARELGIPAVVGCGNATMRLRTGDLVRVNGGQGTVEVLRAAEPSEPLASTAQ